MCSGHVSIPDESMLKDGSLQAWKRRSRECHDVGAAVLPTDAKDSSGPRLLECNNKTKKNK